MHVSDPRIGPGLCSGKGCQRGRDILDRVCGTRGERKVVNDRMMGWLVGIRYNTRLINGTWECQRYIRRAIMLCARPVRRDQRGNSTGGD